ncbi:MAG: hypothetical protein AAFQ67_08385, partial [Pseudomonadota bacterium]
MADGAGDRFERVIPLDGPAVRALPLWGERRCFKGFCVELVPAGPRTVNFKLDQTFASISFAADEGRSSLAGDRLRKYDRRPHEFIVAPPNFPLFGEAAMAPEVLAFEVEFDVVCDAVAKELGVDPTTLRPEVVIGGPDPLATLLAGRIRRRILSAQSGDAHLEALCLCLL